MKKSITAAVLATLFAVQGCADNDVNGGSKPPASQNRATQAVGDGDPTTRPIGETVTLTDTAGHPIQVTVTGITYRDAFAKDKTLAVEGKYALAIAFTIQSKSGGRLGEQSDNWIKWAGTSGTAEEWDYTNAPWQGCIDAYTPHAEVEPHQEYKAITDINVPAKGGTLIIEDHYEGVARWELPKTDAGTGTAPATQFTTEDC